MWETIIAILSAFIGGGLVSLIYDVLNHKRISKAVRSAFLCEIRLIVNQTSSFISSFPQENQYFVQNIATPIFSNNPAIIAEFDNQTQERIYNFYNFIFLLQQNNVDNRYADSLEAQGNFGGAQRIRHDSAEIKLRLRQSIVNSGTEILNNSEIDRF